MKFNYGNSIRVSKFAPIRYNPESVGALCGWRVVENEKTAIEFDVSIGAILCNIEAPDGSFFEVPEEYLIKYEDN